ncbi:hypothetical protein E4U40_006600 [Claviceps sp. LM458 group G5]|nr:hypothetical protein E4U40_006600 [Claviceps sp. LM458 group G5]KAG6043279.1 hypothetical protein E4U39_004753 [Claviceps sp. Clav50 group G5]
MEPVPETERMEAFRSSPVPSLLLRSKPPGIPPLQLDVARKPPTLRRSTDPSPTTPTSPSWGPLSTALPYRPRTTSPLSGHTRSQSAANPISSMSRTQSLPGLGGSSSRILHSPQFRQPGSPSTSGSPSRVRARKKSADEAFPNMSPIRTSVLDYDKRPLTAEEGSSPVFGSATVPSGRVRRPSSPFRSMPPPSPSTLSLFPSTPTSASSFRSYDMLSMGSSGSLSSVPSTPTSARSRSPSISSLETIPDSPDAEEAALEAEKIAQLKAAADAVAETSEEAEGKGRAMDGHPRGRTLIYGSRDKRKRWSVCGAERRGDLDLETIWED